MRRKTLNYVLDGFIVVLLITIVLLIVMIARRGDVPEQTVENTVQPTTAAAQSDTSSEREPAADTQAAEPAEDAPAADASQGAEEQKEYAVVNDSVNVRGGAGTDYDIVGSAFPGEKYEVLDKSDPSWTKVDYGGKEAYIYTEFLDFE